MLSYGFFQNVKSLIDKDHKSRFKYYLQFEFLSKYQLLKKKMIAEQTMLQRSYDRDCFLNPRPFKQPYVRPAGELKSLFDPMLQIDCTFNNLKENVIVLAGQSKSGKSTLSNILAAKAMIGKDNGYGQIVYQAQCGDALNNEGYLISCTAVLNRVDFTDISIIDLAGFQQTRGQNQLLAVVYNIKRLFESGVNVKFLLTVSDHEISAALAKDKFKPYFNFLSLFKDSLDKIQLKKKIFNATMMMFTKTTQPLQTYTKKIKGAIKALDNPAITIQMKAYIKEFLQFMDQQQRYDDFPMAQQGCSPKEFDLLRRKNWEYLSISQEKETYGKFWNQNFKDLYDKMNEMSKKKFNENIALRISQFRNAQEILQSIVNICSSNGAWYENKISFSQVTKMIREFNQKSDFYKSPHMQYVYALTGQSSIADPHGNVKQATGLQLIKQIKNIYCKIMSLQEVLQPQKKKEIYQNLFYPIKSIFESLKLIYCSNSQQQDLFLKFSFNYLRGILQFSQLEDINSQTSSSAPLTIVDTFLDILKESIRIHQYNFIVNMPLDVNKKLFDTHQKREEYNEYIENFFNSLGKLTKKQEKIINMKKIKFIQISVEITRADQLIKDQKKKAALQALLNIIEKIQQYKKDVKNSLENNLDQFSQKDLKEVEMIMINTLKKLGLGLSKAKNLLLAIKVYESINYPLSSIECRKKLISQTIDEGKAFDHHIALGEYCQKVGKRELALQSYYSAMQISTSVIQRENALKKIRGVGTVTMDAFIQELEEKSIEDPGDLISQIKQFVQKITTLEGNKSMVSGSGDTK